MISIAKLFDKISLRDAIFIIMQSDDHENSLYLSKLDKEHIMWLYYVGPKKLIKPLLKIIWWF